MCNLLIQILHVVSAVHMGIMIRSVCRKNYLCPRLPRNAPSLDANVSFGSSTGMKYVPCSLWT